MAVHHLLNPGAWVQATGQAAGHHTQLGRLMSTQETGAVAENIQVPCAMMGAM